MIILGSIYLIFNWLLLNDIINLSIVTEYGYNIMLGRFKLITKKVPLIEEFKSGLTLVIVGILLFFASSIRVFLLARQKGEPE